MTSLKLFAALSTALTALILMAGLIVARRWYIRRRDRLYQLHVRLLRSELMQAVARGDSNFLIAHWTSRDRRAALEVASQILGFLKGPDRKRLEGIVEENAVLQKPLLRINRLRKSRRIASIRILAAFGNQSVQGTLHSLMQYDPSTEVRLEAAIAICVAGELPPPWRILRATYRPGQKLTPNHYLLFRSLVPDRVEAIAALAMFHEDQTIRLLAVDALGFTLNERAKEVLGTVTQDSDPTVAEAARQALRNQASGERRRRPRNAQIVRHTNSEPSKQAAA